MPTTSPANFFAGLPYFFHVLGGRLRHQQVARHFQRELQAEGRKLEELLRDLGKVARQTGLRHPGALAELEAIEALENQRGAADAGSAELDERLKGEEQKFAALEADCTARSQHAQQVIAQTQATLNERNTELRTVKGRLAEAERQVKAFTKQRDDKLAAEAKSQDPAQQEVLQRAAAELAVQIGDHEQQREAAAAEVARLQGPIDQLNATLQEARGRLQEAQKELGAGRQTLAGLKRDVSAQKRQQGVAITKLDRELAEKFLALGRALDAGRVGAPEFTELYARLDATRAEMTERENQAQAVLAARDTYDRQGYKNGLILVLSIAGLVLALALTLIIILSW
ncbi:MAG: hypothetical protein IT371_10925 [Deltaproteobacteria bacterium]|nr:hypothetical protein [Deltaproteobacteria bacterium]